MSIFRRSKAPELHRVRVTVTYYMRSDLETVDLAVHGYELGSIPQQAVDRTKDYALV
ncbi:hypothetical protein M2272_005762 [Mycobacterium frederiksbergense]|uniref:Uncharacterized protein n=1 Tax=Mycolicibacterium frederiksbergense TaxID=117567 RepID=A0ABT6L855_9MYCO|nr:hypothetical protein [Mycolicibacterium frederiksbergense]